MNKETRQNNLLKIVDYGFVVETQPEGFAQVRLPRREGCRTEALSKNICHQLDKESMILRVQNPLKAVKGNKVEVEFIDPGLGKSIFIIYFLPILSLIIGAILGNAFNPLANHNLSAVLGAILFLAICLGLVFGLNRRKWQQAGRNAPRITNILE